MNAGSVVYNMAISEHQAVRSEDEPRPTAMALARLSIPSAAGVLGDLDFRDGRADLLSCGDHRARVGIEQCGVAVWRGLKRRPALKGTSRKKLFGHSR